MEEHLLQIQQVELFAGGGTPDVSNEIDFITIATLGNASDFGNLCWSKRNHAGVRLQQEEYLLVEMQDQQLIQLIM